MRVHKGKTEARNEGIFLCTFLRISSRKINILKKIKLGPRELNEGDDMNVEKNSAYYNEYWNIPQKCQKNEKK